MELTAEELSTLLDQHIKRVEYDGKGERPYDAIVCAMREIVNLGHMPTSATMTAERLEEIRTSPPMPRVEKRPDGKFNLWTPFQQIEVETTAERPDHCTLYDKLDRILGEVELGEQEIAEPGPHGRIE